MTIEDGEGNSFVLDISGLVKPENWNDSSYIIDPNKETMTISVPEFDLPTAEEAAGCTITADGMNVQWSDVYELLEK